MAAQTFTAAVTAIQAHLATAWGARTEIAWDAMNGPEYRPTVGRAWIRPTIVGESGSQKSLGASPRFRRYGVLIVQVFVPSGDGIDVALGHADALVAALEGQSLASGVVFESVSSQRIGRDGDFYQVNISAPFWWDRIS